MRRLFGQSGHPGGPLVHGLLSLPMSFKILGIGGLIALVAGTLVFLQARAALLPELQGRLCERVRSTGFMLESLLWPDKLAGNLSALEEHIQHVRRLVPDIRYIIIQSATGRIIAHSFDRGVPRDLASRRPAPIAEGVVQILTCSEGDVFDAQFALQNGALGRIRVGLSDQSIRSAMSGLTQRILRELGLAVLIGFALALLLGGVLAEPLEQLVSLTKKVGGGDFGVRSRVVASDEIGLLSEAFNGMVTHLEEYRASIQQKEAERLQFVAKLIDSQESDRKAISLDLHDTIGQSLLRLLMSIRAEQDRTGGATGAHASLIEQVEQVITQVRHLAWGMAPPHLGNRGLKSALTRYVAELFSGGALQVDEVYDLPPELPRLSASVEVTLYRVAQEALTNVLRHSAAQRASLVLSRQPGQVMLLVEDAGCGFDPTELRTKARAGIGLVAMRERVNLLAGELLVDSKPGRGTTVRVKIPISEEETPCPSRS